MRIVEGILWWALTILTLLVLDDLLFGPVFWSLAVAAGPVIATLAAFSASWTFQMWLIREGTRTAPNKFAKYFVDRLLFKRSNTHIEERSVSLRSKATSVAGAFLVSPLVGGVIPALALSKKDLLGGGTKKYAIASVLSAIYAIEFALIHGGYGIGGLLSGIIS